MVTNTTVTLDPLGAVTPGAGGDYVYTDVANGSYSLTGATTKGWNGSNTFDATLILRYSAGVPGYDFFTNLQKRAADVNLTGTVNTFDATLISRRAASIATPQWTAPNFVFDGPYPGLSGYPVNVAGGIGTANIKALCSGDVNGNYTPPAK
jgi:hypothetical protein